MSKLSNQYFLLVLGKNSSLYQMALFSVILVFVFQIFLDIVGEYPLLEFFLHLSFRRNLFKVLNSGDNVFVLLKMLNLFCTKLNCIILLLNSTITFIYSCLWCYTCGFCCASLWKHKCEMAQPQVTKFMHTEPFNYNIYDNSTEAFCIGFNICMAEKEDIIRYEMMQKCIIGGSLT